MKKIESALLATTLAVGLALAGGSAYAADLMDPGPGVVTEAAPEGYVSVFGGFSFGNSVTGFSTQTGVNVTTPYNAGYIVGGAVGMKFTPNVRGEFELSYGSRTAEGPGSPFATGGGSAYATGSLSTLYLLGNLWYDFDTGSGITPYIGGGIGAAVVMPDVELDGTPAGYKTDAVGIAGQLGAGIKFQVADNMAIDLSYRARGVANANLHGTGGVGDFTGVHYIDQAVQVGLDIGF